MSFQGPKILLLVVILYSCGKNPEPRKLRDLSREKWEFRQTGDSIWREATVPGLVHTDLLNHKLIPHPWMGLNEEKVQWVEDQDWAYKCNFDIDKNQLKSKHINLIFKGLDTYAEVELNGTKILEANNMFREWLSDVRPFVKEKSNVLVIRFRSPVNHNLPVLDTASMILPASSESVDIKVSPYVRKAPYHFGWDWGPRLVTSGIWRPVLLETWDKVKIDNVRIKTKSLSDNLAFLEAEIQLSSDKVQEMNLSILDNEYKLDLKEGQNTITREFSIRNPELWWPNGWGKAGLYDIPVVIKFDGNTIDSLNIHRGLRKVELVQERDSIGESFYFRINGKDIFIKGANYIPQSHFVPELKESDYRKLLQKVRDAGMNMLRVWGGGIYEEDIFYELCDEFGIMVWQDFMFANTMYPIDAEFLMNVKQEVRDNVCRLRNHPSIVHWNGNNEIEVAWKNWGWQKQFEYSEEDSAKLWNAYIRIFHDSIPYWLSLYDDRSYTSTSPLSNWGKPENFNYGSMHYWGVWHGNDEFEDYRKNVGRFMAEYGFQSFPNMETIEYFADSGEMKLDSDVMQAHQKSYVGNGIIEKMIDKYHSGYDDFDDFVIKSQKVQARAMQIAIDAHRLNRGHCMGTLFWQLNDCWPGPSWSAIDVFGREKEFYKDLKTLYAPVALIPEIRNDSLSISLVNDLPEDFKGLIRINLNYKNGHNGTMNMRTVCEAGNLKKVYYKKLIPGFKSLELSVFRDDEMIFQREMKAEL